MTYELSDEQVNNMIVFMNLALKNKPDLQGTDALAYANIFYALKKQAELPQEMK